MPKVKITKAIVEQIPHPEKGQVIFCDTEMNGFYLIVGKSSKTFVAQRDMGGKAVRHTIGRYGRFTVEEARKIAKEKLYMMSLGMNPNAPEHKDKKIVTLDVALTEYLATRRNLGSRTRKDYQYYIDHYFLDWKSRLMEEITKDMIGLRHSMIAKNNGNYVANKGMRILRALFNFIHATYDICQVNPVIYLTHVRGWCKETRRRTYIKPSELPAWWQAVHSLANDTYRDFFLLLIFTGLRRGEASAMKWEHINFADKTFTIPVTKNGDPLTLPMGDFLISLLTERKKRYGNYQYVFPGPGVEGHLAEPKKGVYQVIEKSGVKFTCHDLRRTFITIAESLEISGYALKRLINHRVTDVTGGYIIVDVDRLRKPAHQVEQFILEKISAYSCGT